VGLHWIDEGVERFRENGFYKEPKATIVVVMLLCKESPTRLPRETDAWVLPVDSGRSVVKRF